MLIATIRDQGRTVSWLARRLGISRQYTSDFVHGKYAIRPEIAHRTSDLLGLPFFSAFNVSSGTDVVSTSVAPEEAVA